MRFIADVLLLLRPGIIRRGNQYHSFNQRAMYKHYLTVGWRNLARNKAYSLINIGGLALGMTVAMFIGLWMYSELSFEKYHDNYNQVVQVLQHAHIGDGIVTDAALPIPLARELRSTYPDDFSQIAATLYAEQTISYEDKAFSQPGLYSESGLADILKFEMVQGTPMDLRKESLLINSSLAKALFGENDPINKTVILNNSYPLQVTGVYKDMPEDTRFSTVHFVAPVEVLFPGGQSMDNWHSASFQIYALLNTGTSAEQVSPKIENELYQHAKDPTKPELFLNPMRRWHLYEFANGEIVAGRLQYVRLFGVIGIFVLLLACINFMNLSTARSERRSKEVGLRKAIGSQRIQLVSQFLGESFIVVAVSLLVALVLVELCLPLFNELSGKQLNILWSNPGMWLLMIVFCVFTSLVAGSYPALYLSSFNVVSVLKGTFKAGPLAATPRKVLVVVQFTVSVTLIIGTVTVYQQIEFAKNRPVGYERNNVVTIPYNPSEIKSYEAFRNELMATQAVSNVTASSSPTTGVWSSADNLDWRGKDPDRQELFGTILVDPEYGDVVRWKLKDGRNFSRQFPSDSMGFIFNESAIRQMGLKEPLGEIVKWHGKDWTIIGVVEDMVMRSPFDPALPTVFLMNTHERSFGVINVRMNPSMATAEAVNRIETVFKRIAPGAPFTYKFSDQEYALKFRAEERVGKLASVFAALAILISCCGLFALASFVAEQRTKEIGIRKVMGATVTQLWRMLSVDFVVLVVISCVIAIPLSYYFMAGWLQNYQYHTGMSLWIFVSTAGGALAITLLTVSFQAIKAAVTNPVKSLRSE